MDGVKLEFESEVFEYIVDKAIEYKLGARWSCFLTRLLLRRTAPRIGCSGDPAMLVDILRRNALFKGFYGGVRVALLRAALGSCADRAIIPMYDWLGLGAEAHLNTPGKLGGNWAWRAANGFEEKALAKTIREECDVYCRV